MPAVFTTALVLSGLNALDTASGGYLSKTRDAAFEKVVGDTLGIAVKKTIALISNKGLELPENHDLQKAIRKSMLDATALVHASLTEEKLEPEFTKKLEKWITEQSKPAALDAIDKWANWSNAAEGSTELFFATQQEYRERKKQMTRQMAADWLQYVAVPLGYGTVPAEEGLVPTKELPSAFREKVLNGFSLGGKQLMWADAVMVNFAELLRNPESKLGKRANDAFQQNFLAEIKSQVTDLKGDTSEILRLVRNSFPDHAVILELNAKAMLLQQELLAAQHKTNDELRIEIQQQKAELAAKDEMIFRAITEGSLAKGQLLILKEDRDKQEKRIEVLIRENETLKQEAIAERKDTIDRLKDEGEEDDLLARAAVLMEEGRFMEARELQIRSAQELKAYSKESAKQAAQQYFELAELDRRELRYADALLHYREAVELQPEEPHCLNGLGNFLGTMALHDEAIIHLEKALCVLEAIDEQSWLKGTVLNNLGVSRSAKGQFDRAITYYEQALVIDRRVFGEEHLSVAIRLNNLGTAWKSKWVYEEAINYYEQALVILEKVYGEEHPHVASTLANLGSVWNSLGEYGRAIDYLEQALALHRKVFGGGHPHVATSLNNLGLAWHSKGEFDRAISSFEQALDIYQNVFGREHPHVAACLNNLGYSWESKGEYDRVIDYFEQSLSIVRKVFGEEHPLIANSFNNLGSVWDSKGEYDRAIEYYELALAIDCNVLGKEHPSIAIRLNNLGCAWFSKEEYKRAIIHFEQALDIFVKFLGEEHPHSMAASGWLAAARAALASQTPPPSP